MTNRIPRSRWPLVPLVLLVVVVCSGVVKPMPTMSRASILDVPAPAAYLPLVTNGGMVLLQPTRTAAITVTATTAATLTHIPTSTASNPPTATITPIATPTSTATLSDTRYCTGVYPIAIGALLLDMDAEVFVPPSNTDELQFYLPYSDDLYQDKWQRRIYMTPGLSGYGYLQWLKGVSSGSALALSTAMTGTGTLDKGFEEVVPWPYPDELAPDGYPLLPGQPSNGDWLYGVDGLVASAALQAAFDYHIQQRTVMTLPSISKYIGVGQTSYFSMLRFDTFLLRGYGPGYLDLVYLGTPNRHPCTPP